ncbi:protein-export chaperone SecB [Candidatus Pelagibacter sp. Uisw_113]|uniref:protein-export chaperone SecB n=1 Tax=Candidatus Pelagibacter sp. Uisw_113 TaxID=3230994 RepID=UPI0039EB3457
MTENFKILAEFVKDISSETPDVQSYIFVKENISKYNLKIDIISKALKDKMIEVNTTMKFEDKELNEKRSYFEIVYASIIKINDNIKDKQDLEKIVLCDVQNKIYPNLKKTFLDLLHNSGFPEVKLDKQIDFSKLYKQRSN